MLLAQCCRLNVLVKSCSLNVAETVLLATCPSLTCAWRLVLAQSRAAPVDLGEVKVDFERTPGVTYFAHELLGDAEDGNKEPSFSFEVTSGGNFRLVSMTCRSFACMRFTAFPAGASLSL